MYVGMQVAAYADTHILVRKHDSDGRAETAFQVLDDASSRVGEVADMLGLDAAVAERLLQEARDDVAASATAAASAHCSTRRFK
jgi:DNA repair ATPase RecN